MEPEKTLNEQDTVQEMPAPSVQAEVAEQPKSPPLSPLQQWWEAADVPAKEYAAVSKDGNLILKETAYSPARSIAQLKSDAADAAVKALSEKFAEIETKMRELSDEWEKAEDKSRMLSKTSRMYDYLQGAAALGDYTPLYAKLSEWRKELGQLEDDNYAAKEALVLAAEKIAGSNEWKDGANKLRELGEQWKSLGNIDKTRNDGLWDRLEAARSGFNQRKREHSEEIEKEHMRNLDLKMELVDKAEALAASEEWKKTTEAFKELMEEWKKTGRTVADKNEALWQRFISAKNVFYDRKRRHYEEIQQEQESNYTVKLALVEKAESLSDSTDWNATTNAYAQLMEDWKSSGRVGNEKGEELWQRMSKAKDIFFNAKRQHFETVRVDLDDNLAQKMALVKRAGQLQHSTQWREATDEFAELMEEWKRIGPVPRERTEEIWQQFSASRRAFFDKKDADRDRRKVQIQRQQSARLQQTRDFLKTLKDELKDEEERIAEFAEGIKNTGTHKKELELKAHLEKLVAQGGPSIERKQKKIAEVEQQLAQLEKEEASKGRERRPARTDAPPVQNRTEEMADESIPPAIPVEEPAQETATEPEPIHEPADNRSEEEPAGALAMSQEPTEHNAAGEQPAQSESAVPELHARTHAELDNIPAAETENESVSDSELEDDRAE